MKEDCEIQDLILEKFRGNVSWAWNAKSFPKDTQPEKDVHHENFYRDIHSDYFVIENNLRFLIHDGALIEEDQYMLVGSIRWIKLSSGGFHTLSNVKKYGYAAKEKKRKTNSIINWATLIITAIGLVIAAISLTLQAKESNKKPSDLSPKQQHYHSR